MRHQQRRRASPDTLAHTIRRAAQADRCHDCTVSISLWSTFVRILPRGSLVAQVAVVQQVRPIDPDPSRAMRAVVGRAAIAMHAAPPARARRRALQWTLTCQKPAILVLQKVLVRRDFISSQSHSQFSLQFENTINILITY